MGPGVRRDDGMPLASRSHNPYITRAKLCRASEAIISPGPYRSFRELSLARFVDLVTWCPPTFVGAPGSSASTAIAASHFCFARHCERSEAIQLRRVGKAKRAHHDESGHL